MTVELGRMICIGGATVDRKYRAKSPIQPRTSNPVTSERSFGGVARNVAENAARLEVKVSLVSAVGQDENGQAIRAGLEALNIDTRHVMTCAGHATAEYVALLEANGDLAVGLADMAIFDTLTPAWLDQVWPEISGSWVFADCNLPPETLSDLIGLAHRDSAVLAVDAVSALKVRRLPRDLAGVGILFLNLDEAQACLETADASPEALTEALLARGAARVVLTLGANGLIAADHSGCTRVRALPVEVVDATGAGDALIAGTLVASLKGRSLPEAVRLGGVAAALTLENSASVRPDLSPALLESAFEQRSSPFLEREPL